MLLCVYKEEEAHLKMRNSRCSVLQRLQYVLQCVAVIVECMLQCVLQCVLQCMLRCLLQCVLQCVTTWRRRLT